MRKWDQHRRKYCSLNFHRKSFSEHFNLHASNIFCLFNKWLPELEAIKILLLLKLFFFRKQQVECLNDENAI